ncbi:MAG TPA: homocysteine S-methyltransferase family protein [Pseudomonas sp.]|uniref:homocysteine S-methyltransferase family protein n=1 Tax=Pseudomonas sp. TaxID=306 RepID=UPI002ED994A6
MTLTTLGRRPIAGTRESSNCQVYANAFPVVSENAEANATLLDIREDLGPAAYLLWAPQWVEQGATIVGGCCGIGPEHIGELERHLVPVVKAKQGVLEAWRGR